MPDFMPIDDVIISNSRIRKDFNDDHIEALACSLYTKGYIHFITLRNNSNELVAGENRIRAHSLLLSCGLTPLNCPFGSVPFNRLSDLPDDDVLEAELEENVLRKDLTWQEETKAIALLHELRQSQHTDWTFADTANELVDPGKTARGSQRTKVSEALIIADHLDDPLVANASNKKEAVKAIKKKNEQLARKKAVEDFDSLLSEENQDVLSDKPPRTSLHTLIRGDFLSVVKDIPDGEFDIVLTDPPYGIDIHKKGTFDSDTHEYDDSKEYFDSLVAALARESYRVTRKQAHAYVFCDVRRWHDLDVAFFSAGWDVWPRPLIWHKGNIGSFANSDIGPRSTYECILYANKGRREVQVHDMDVILVNQSTHTEHPASKPVPLYENLLARSGFPGNKVIDFFCGSGPIFPAAQSQRLIATGIELNEKYHAMAHERYLATFK